MDNILLLIVKVPQNSFTAFSMQFLEQSQLRGSEETVWVVRTCCGEDCFANSKDYVSSRCSPLLLHPPPWSFTDLHLCSCLAASGSSHFHPTCILSDVIPAGADLRQLLLPSSPPLSGLKFFWSSVLNPSPTTHAQGVWGEIPWSCNTLSFILPSLL